MTNAMGNAKNTMRLKTATRNAVKEYRRKMNGTELSVTQRSDRYGIISGTKTGDPEYDCSSAKPIIFDKAMAISQQHALLHHVFLSKGFAIMPQMPSSSGGTQWKGELCRPVGEQPVPETAF